MRPTLPPTSRAALSSIASIAIGLCLLLLGETLQATRSDAAPSAEAHSYTLPVATPEGAMGPNFDELEQAKNGTP
jgi:hypothetical protein